MSTEMSDIKLGASQLTYDKTKDNMTCNMKRADFIFGDSRPVMPTDPKKDVRLSCRVEECTRVRLMSVAKRHRRRPSLLIRHAVERFLDLVEAQDAPAKSKSAKRRPG
ncbi:MAG: hypothetical protein WCS65_01415 [Verrucomicrobiae bacterium]